jgi:hypothetical protein
MKRIFIEWNHTCVHLHTTLWSDYKNLKVKKKRRKPRLHLHLSTLDLHLPIFFYNLQTETVGEVLIRFKMFVRPRANLFIWNPLD